MNLRRKIYETPSGFKTKALISIYYSTIISIHNAEWWLSNDVHICKSFRIPVLTCLLLLNTRRLFERFADYCFVPLDNRSFKVRM